MSKQKIIDVHAHILDEETIRLLQRESSQLAPRLSRLDDGSTLLEVAGIRYRPFPQGAWDMDQRFKDMKAAEIDMQVLSVIPQTFLYGQDPSLTAAFSQIQNDCLARLVSEYPDQFMGIATLPMQAPELAANELRRAMRSLGLCGAMIGSNVDGKNLDDPALDPLWAAAAELNAFILIHPVKIAGADRMQSYYLVNLIGNPLDTSIAAAALVFGGVLERYPTIKFCLAHGGGFVPYQVGRWIHGWKVRPEPKQRLRGSPEHSLDRFYYDTILHSRAALEFLVDTAGASRVLLGSDYPFDMGMYDCVGQVSSLSISEADRQIILGRQAEELFKQRHNYASRSKLPKKPLFPE